MEEEWDFCSIFRFHPPGVDKANICYWADDSHEWLEGNDIPTAIDEATDRLTRNGWIVHTINEGQDFLNILFIRQKQTA